MTERSTIKRTEDAVDLLKQQHQEIKTLFAATAANSGEQRRRSFEQLVRLLSIHETAEEEIVHPQTRRLPGGERMIQTRLREEEHAKRLLAELDRMGPEAPQFPERLARLRETVLSHAEHEERDEFVALRKHFSPEQLRGMAVLIKAAQAIAPTRPHPQVRPTARANLIAGLPIAVLDRTRDLLRGTGRALRTMGARQT
ncbi:hypothetical protein TH66_21740 [Carbonactinospora thermoautotrophica]|uniref:Hemerythrin HHE cation binding domain protein n=1 Tax=Carbonactinospora thermoautotrophica TaxID=1469144 RepID=A0A132MJF1_9ACTN|nr:hemerythrin domain-containing protein [Carbonactinospora thermoautotrophica]KWW97974.1 hypothetical protein TH66_21740 [Carbonactinospora thermoautotrophica]KWX03118.1 Hemerythrin HHE cation binding domain protein [Carbonactinospora thermoautotrophica]KWX09124.1 hypothetical protein TR74_11485 [Carbonactinospora thermoautotrophica]